MCKASERSQNLISYFSSGHALRIELIGDSLFINHAALSDKSFESPSVITRSYNECALLPNSGHSPFILVQLRLS